MLLLLLQYLESPLGRKARRHIANLVSSYDNTSMVWTYRGQISDLHPECIVWKLLQALGSDHQALVEEAANEVNNEKAERTEKKEKGDLQLLFY